MSRVKTRFLNIRGVVQFAPNPSLGRLFQGDVSYLLDRLFKEHADFLRMSRARARSLSQHERVQNVCVTEGHAAGAGGRHSKQLEPPQ